MKTAFYIRMSTDKQENSIDSQNAVLLTYAKSHKMQVVEKYIDEGISGRTAEKRPAFMQMVEDSAKGIFDAVLVYDSSRFARNLEESIVYKSALKRNGVKLISITEPSLDDDSALITDAMLGAINEMFSRKLSKSVKRGMVFKAQNGIYQTPPPYGYKKKNGVMEIIEEEAAVVRRVFEMFTECPSWHSVAVKLNGMCIRKRSAYGWYSRDIKRMLLNEAYIGNVYYDGKTYKGKHEPIIDAGMWNDVRALISEKPAGRQRPPTSYKHWLSGLLKCYQCGGRMNHVTDGRGNTSFRCSRHANGCCSNSNFMSVPKLEELTMKTFSSFLADENLLGYEYFVQRQSGESGLEALQAALKKLRAKQERHKNAYAAGVDTLEEYKTNKELCRKEERALTEKIDAFSGKSVTTERINNHKLSITQLLELLFSREYTTEQKSIAVHKVVQKIVFNKNTGELTIFYFL